MKTCYLVGFLDGDRIVQIGTYSAPPWDLTGVGGRGREAVLLWKASGETYEKAEADLRRSYPVYMPELAKRLPFPC